MARSLLLLMLSLGAATQVSVSWGSLSDAHAGLTKDAPFDATEARAEAEFNELAWFLKRAGFLQLEHTYLPPASCQSTVYSSVVHEGQRKVIRNDGNSGPVELWAIQRAIEGVLETAKWKRLGRAKTKPGARR